MKRIILYPHGGSGNHGCEAIVRTTLNLINADEVILFSENPEQDLKYIPDLRITVKKPYKLIRRFSLDYFTILLHRLVNKKSDYADMLYCKPVIEKCDDQTVLLSIGGDNYCYGDNDYMYMVNRHARKKGTKTVLWCASVDKKLVTEKMESDLSQFDLLIARESETYDYLKTIGRKTAYSPDPAFLLSPEKGNCPEGLGEKPYIGINISPLIISYEKDQGIIYRNYCRLIDYILSETDFNIALIPHVVWEHNDDRKPINRLYTEYKESGRVFKIEDQSCVQLKDIIAGCYAFVGARTHATIAAYSSCVPTVVAGYSIKSAGIGKDIFNSPKNYIVPVNDLKSDEVILNAFKDLLANREEIREYLEKTMPDYIGKTDTLKTILNDL